MSISPATIKIVQATAPVVAEHALQITSTFYKTMFTNNPEVKEFFNAAHQSHGKQPRALADAVVQYALHIDQLGALGPLVEKIAHRHCALSIKPEHYGIVHKNLMLAIGEVLGDAVTPEIGAAWDEAVLALAGVCIGAEEELYKAAEAKQGGWRFERDFVVDSKTSVADGVTELAFRPADGYSGTFEYLPGQYTTVRIPETDHAPRHYSLIQEPNAESLLRCAVRRVEGGVYSNYIHDKLQVGDKVRLGAPYGADVPAPDATSIALVAAGIGITPTRSILRAFGKDKVKAGLFVNRTDATTAFKEDMLASGADLRFVNTAEAGRPNLAKEAERLVNLAGVDALYYICGPTHFMAEATAALEAKGATKVITKVFGTGTVSTNEAADAAGAAAPKCPMHA